MKPFDTVKDHPIVEALFGKQTKVLRRLRRIFFKQFKSNCAFVGLNNGGSIWHLVLSPLRFSFFGSKLNFANCEMHVAKTALADARASDI